MPICALKQVPASNRGAGLPILAVFAAAHGWAKFASNALEVGSRMPSSTWAQIPQVVSVQ